MQRRDHLGAYLLRQKRRLQFYKMAEAFVIALFVFFAVFQIGLWFEYFGESLEGIASWNHWFRTTGLFLGILLAGATFVLRARRHLQVISAQRAAEEVERQSQFFEKQPQYLTELQTAGAFLTDKGYLQDEHSFQRAHLEAWKRRLGAFKVELYPQLSLLAVLLIIVGLVIPSTTSLNQNLTHSFPERVQAWTPSTHESKLPYSGAKWEEKQGSIRVIEDSRVRLAPPNREPFQVFLFTNTSGDVWQRHPCFDTCEFQARQSGQYAVGTLFSRSSVYPLQVLQDEAPKAVLFFEDGEDLIPNARIELENEAVIDLKMLASDDVRLTKVELKHEYDDEVQTLFSTEKGTSRFREDFELEVEDWPGGEHRLYMDVWDDAQTSRSPEIIVYYSDEEIRRKERILNLRTLLNEWIHVLADLLEATEDGEVDAALGERLQSIDYSGDFTEAPLISVFVEELRRLGERIYETLLVEYRYGELSDLIERTEEKILYGLSLIFQERTGDLQSSRKGLEQSQKNLHQMLQEIRDGEMGMDSEDIQDAFDEVMQQLQDMQEKVAQLPQGPSDELVNREALEEQAQHGEDLEERINEIQELLKEGEDAQALRELESLINQLSILSKAMEDALEQWEENLAQGSMEASEDLQESMDEIRQREEDLVERTREVREHKEELEEMSQWEPVEESEWEALESELESLEQEQASIQEDFQSLVSEFDESLEGTEWEQAFRSQETQELEERILEGMEKVQDDIDREELYEAVNTENEVIEHLRQASEAQQQIRQQLEQLSQQSPAADGRKSERINIVEREGRGERERRRQIMDSLRQEVDEEFQPSHERYFEELLQR